MTLNQLMTYTLMATVFHQELNIISPATSSLWEGSVIGRFTRPVPVPVSFIAETIGRWWIPNFLFFGLPLLIISPFLHVNPAPADSASGLMAFISLMLSASLGFALDLLFAAFAMFLKNGCWAAASIREAAFSLLSGEMIPFALFPWGDVYKRQGDWYQKDTFGCWGICMQFFWCEEYAEWDVIS